MLSIVTYLSILAIGFFVFGGFLASHQHKSWAEQILNSQVVLPVALLGANFSPWIIAITLNSAPGGRLWPIELADSSLIIPFGWLLCAIALAAGVLSKQLETGQHSLQKHS